MKKLLFIAVLAASIATFGAHLIECSSDTKVLSPIAIKSVQCASTNLTGTVSLTNRIDVSYSTNTLARVVVTNGWTIGIGRTKTPIVNTNTVIKAFRVERHVDVPLCQLTIASGFAATNGLTMHASPGDRILVSGTPARVFVYGD